MMRVLYKLMEKMLAIRMTPIFAEVVSPHQHGFIKGKSIYDNILAAMVGMEYAKFPNQECVLFQLDLDKVYNFISWSSSQKFSKCLGLALRFAICSTQWAQVATPNFCSIQWWLENSI